MKMLADIVNDENWCRGAIARDDLGNKLADVQDVRAVSHCMLGWLHKKYKLKLGKLSPEYKKAEDKVYRICLRKYGKSLTASNDSVIKDAAEVASIFAEARI